MSVFSITGFTVSYAARPTASFSVGNPVAIVGAPIVLDGRASEGELLSYFWEFVSTPLNSQARINGLVVKERGVVTFTPDIVGEYVLRLRVFNGVQYSPWVSQRISARAMLTPYARGYVPDGKFIWSYLRDVWQQVESKEWFETLWSALIQVVGADMLDLYQNDFAKSIQDIQDTYQRRWLDYSPKLLLGGPSSLILETERAGLAANTTQVGRYTEAIAVSDQELVIVEGSVSPDAVGVAAASSGTILPQNSGSFRIQGLNSDRTGYRLADETTFWDEAEQRPFTESIPVIFDFRSNVWELLAPVSSAFTDYALLLSQHPTLVDVLAEIFGGGMSVSSLGDVRVGDVLVIRSGQNRGHYRILSLNGSIAVMDRQPPSSSDGTSYFAGVYRPFPFQVSLPPTTHSASLAIDSRTEFGAPGVVFSVGGGSYEIQRTYLNPFERTSTLFLVATEPDIPVGQSLLSWRLGHTLIMSEDMGNKGVRAGDQLWFEVSANGQSIQVPVQVTGVAGKRIGFTLSTSDLVPGEVGAISNELKALVLSRLRIPGVVEDRGTYTFEGQAAAVLADLERSVAFRRMFGTPQDSSQSYTLGDFAFVVKPVYLIRNSCIPVAEELVSVPALQKFIKRPIDGPDPVYLENNHYTLDAATSRNRTLLVDTNTNVFRADGVDISGTDLVVNDSIVIKTPSTLAGEYRVVRLVAGGSVELDKPIPAYTFGTQALCTLRLKRALPTKMLRFVPGLFTAENPAPERLWAEASFFDNGATIESNFGFLVGLTRDDFVSITSGASYRQAVLGLMYSATTGSSLEKLRAGMAVLLGIPLVEKQGIIRSIDEQFLVDQNGKVRKGSVLVEDLSDTGTPLGVFRTYTYPIDELSSLAGLSTNPVTGVPYIEGDTVEAYTILSGGVLVQDYTTGSGAVGPKKFHSILVTYNDEVVRSEEVPLLSKFLRQLKAAHILASLRSLTEVADDVRTDDKLILKLSQKTAFVDNIGLGFDLPLMFDAFEPRFLYPWNAGSISYNNGSYDVTESLEGHVLAVRRYGTDLELFTVDGDNANFRLTGGGLVNPRGNEEFKPPLLKEPGYVFTPTPDAYLLVLEGDFKGCYRIDAIISDFKGTLTVGNNGTIIGNYTGLRYAIVWKMNPIISSPIVVADGSNTVTITSAGLVGERAMKTDLVAPGDVLNVLTASVPTRRILEVIENNPGHDELVLDGPVAAGTWGTNVIRNWMKGNYNLNFNVTGPGKYDPDTFSREYIENGDELRLISTSTGLTVGYVTVIDAINGIFTPNTIPSTVYNAVMRRNRRARATHGTGDASDSVSFTDQPFFYLDFRTLSSDTLDHDNVGSEVFAGPRDTSASAAMTNGSPTVSLATLTNPRASGIRPTDRFVAMSGAAASVDSGYGPGVFIILSVSTTDITLTTNATATENVSWSIQRRLQ